jgi:hypothetical protein
MNWTTQHPTIEGYYWVRHNPCAHTGKVMTTLQYALDLEDTEGNEVLHWEDKLDGWEEPVTCDPEGTQYYGPIEPPPFD